MKVVADYQMPKITAESFYLENMVPGEVLNNLASGMQSLVQGKADGKKVMEEAQK